MDMITLLRERRSIRKFRNTSVERKKRHLLIESLLRSPSSRSLNPWEFFMVDDPDLLQALSRCKPHGAAFLAGAPLAVVVTADPEKCDVWIEDCAIASILVQMTAQSLGLGSCWVQVRLRKHADGRPAEHYVRQLLNLPEGFRILSIIGIGYPDEHPEPHASETLDQNKIRWINE